MAKIPDHPEPPAALDADLGTLKSALPELDDCGPLLSRCEARFAAEERGLVGWLRSRPSRLRFLLAAGVAAIPVLHAFSEAHAGTSGAGHAGLSLAMAALLLGAVWLGMRPLSRRAFSPTQVLGALGLALGALLLINGWPGPRAGVVREGATVASCLGTGLLFALPIYLWLRLLDRGDNPHAPVLALAAGVSANFALNLHCAGLGPLHDVLGHFAVVVLLLGLHALLARRHPSPRSA
jgi:hypothetical protein